MTYFPVQSPYPIFTDDDGTPLESGYIYIGEANQNPITNPINIYWDAEGLYPAAQPVRTIGGYPDRNGSPGKIYVSTSINADYSIIIKDKHLNTVYYTGAVIAANSSYNTTVDSISELRRVTSGTNALYVRGHTAIGDGGGGIFEYVDGAAPGTYTDDNGYTIVPSGGDGSAAWLRQSENGYVKFQEYGGNSDGTTDNLAAMVNMLPNVIGKTVFFPAGTYYFSDGFTIDATYAKIEFRGESFASSILEFEDGSYTAIINEYADGNSFKNLTLRSNESTTPQITLLDAQASPGDQSGVITIDQCTLTRALICFKAEASTGTPYTIRVLNCEFATADVYIYWNNVLNGVINGCTFGTALELTTDALVEVGGTGVKVINNQFETYTSKKSIYIGGRSIVQGNYIRSDCGNITAKAGGFIDISSNAFESLSYTTINGYSPYGIETEYNAAGGAVNINSNIIRVDNSEANIVAIQHDTHQGGTIVGNFIYRATGGKGIYCRKGTVIGNSMTQTATPVYTDSNSLDVVVMNNHHSGSGGVYDLYAGTVFDEEGTFTPVVEGLTTAGAGTYTVQFGSYFKSKNWVHFRIQLTWTAHTGTGDMVVTGLPYTANATRTAAVTIIPQNLTFTGDFVSAFINASSDTIYLYNASTGAALSAVAIDTAAGLYLAGSYEI